MLRLRRRALLGPAVVHATTQARSSTTAASRPSSSSGQTTPSNASSSSSSSSMGAMLAAGVLLAAAADLGYPQYQQIEADRRAAAALRTGGAALPATTAAAGALPSSAGGVGHAGGPPAPIPITIEAASQRVQVVVVEKGSVGQHSGSSNGERLVFLPREALRRRVQGDTNDDFGGLDRCDCVRFTYMFNLPNTSHTI